MAENPSDSIDDQIKLHDNEPSASFQEFRVNRIIQSYISYLQICYSQEMVNIALNLDSTSTSNDDSKTYI